MSETNKPLVIVQARTGSTRLPNKMLMPFADGKPVLEILLSRLVASLGQDAGRLIVATTVNPSDNGIIDLCVRAGVKSFRGSEQDVLDRFIQAAHTHKATKLIRVCADNVFLDASAFRYLYDLMSVSDYDYESFRTSDGTPSIRTHYGFWTEGVTTQALERVADMTDEKLYHEHVTNFIYANPDSFSLHFTPISDVTYGVEQYPNLRLTLDTADDFKVQQTIYETLRHNNLDITPQNIFTYMETNPMLYDVMRKNIEANSK